MAEYSLLNPSILIQIHDLILPFPKGQTKTIDWTAVRDADWDTPLSTKRQLFAISKPIWKALSQRSHPLSISPPSPAHPQYLEQCLGLIWLLDQPGGFLRGKDLRYSGGFFRPAADKLALELYHSPASPFEKKTWLERGWTFEDYIARIFTVWAPLIHSETIMQEHWNDLQLSILKGIRADVEAYTGRKDPGAATQEADEKDVRLFDDLITRPLVPVHNMADFVFPMLRIIIAHVPVINRFGRYPYRNDSLGRDFVEGEEEWIESTKSFGRMDKETRDTIRRDVDQGVWSPLLLDYDLE